MRIDPLEECLLEYVVNKVDDNPDAIDCVETSNEWTTWRSQLTNEMYNEWR